MPLYLWTQEHLGVVSRTMFKIIIDVGILELLIYYTVIDDQ